MAWRKNALDVNTKIASGVVPVSGTGARSVCLSFRNAAIAYATSPLYMLAWGNHSAAGEGWRFRLNDGLSYALRVEVGSGGFNGSTTGLNDGNWHTVAYGVGASSNLSDALMYLDGAAESLSITTRTVNTNTTEEMFLGATNATDGPNSHYAEVAVYNRLLDAAEMAMLTAGHITPAHIPRGRILYWPLIRDYVDLDGLSTPTALGSNYEITSHPRVIYPSAQILQFPPTAAGGGVTPYPYGQQHLDRQFAVIAAAKLGGVLQ